MAVCKDIYGKHVDLKCVTVDDAEFTLQLRQDPEFVKFLPRIDNTIEEQKEWIKKQREKNDDYFFCVWSKTGERLGTVGIIDVFDNPPKGARLALKGNPMENIEGYMLALQFAFYTLKIDNLWGFAYAENERAIRFDLQYGAVFKEPTEYENGRMIRELTHSKSDFEKALKKLMRMIYRGGIPEDMTYFQELNKCTQ